MNTTREQFESDAVPYGFDITRAECPCCSYKCHDTETRWMGWQAALSAEHKDAEPAAIHDEEIKKVAQLIVDDAELRITCMKPLYDSVEFGFHHIKRLLKSPPKGEPVDDRKEFYKWFKTMMPHDPSNMQFENWMLTCWKAGRAALRAEREPVQPVAIRNATLDEAANLVTQWGNARTDDGGGNALRNCALAILDLKTAAPPKPAISRERLIDVLKNADIGVYWRLDYPALAKTIIDQLQETK